jgi:hypothetical protein
MRLFALVLVAALLVACLDSGISPLPGGPDDPYLGLRSACSTGPAYPNETTFPEGPRESRQPVCIERCGEHEQLKWGPSSSGPTFDAVPSGRCGFDGEARSMVAVRRCCGSDHGQAYLFECRCATGAWSCKATVHGGDPCLCSDAG